MGILYVKLSWYIFYMSYQERIDLKLETINTILLANYVFFIAFLLNISKTN